MRKFWSESEIEVLRKNYPTSTKREMMALLPGRSAVSIGHKASRLGISNEISNWTTTELEILRNGYSCLDKEELLRSLPKKRWTSIRHKASELGLKYDFNKFYRRTWKSFDNVVLTDIEKGYLAGVLDSDGSITIKKAVDKRVDKVYYAPLLSFYNTNANLMSKIRKIVKIGRFYGDYSSKRKNSKYKPKYTYNVGSINGVKQILEQITPLLSVKKSRAELVLEFISLKENRKKGAMNPRILEIYDEIRELNNSRAYLRNNKS